MGNFNRGGRSDFRHGGGRRDQRRDDRREDRQMYQATCTECGKSCEVPFKPTGSKPVLCRDCFRGGRSDQRSDHFGGGGRDSERQMYSATCEKCGKHCEVPFRPSGDKPVYCRDCFSSRGEGTGGKSTEHFDQQFNLLNEKLDKILKRLTPTYMREHTESIDSAEAGEDKTVTKKKATKKRPAK